MLKKLVNEAFCTLRITTTGPLLDEIRPCQRQRPRYDTCAYVAQWQTGSLHTRKFAQRRVS